MNNSSMPQISLIVPVYNAEKYLHRCINSILEQTFTDFELLLINDGSKDMSGKICDEYAAKDSRVYVFHKENGGVSSARNVALDEAKGAWVTFIDSDDWIANDYLMNLYGAVGQGGELAISYATLVHNDGVFQRLNNANNVIQKENFQNLFIEYNLHIYTSPWGKLYKKQIIDNEMLRFCEGMHIGEDLLFLYSYMLCISKICVISYSGYYYCFELSGTLTKKVNSLESELLGLSNIINIVDKICNDWLIESIEAKSNLYWIKGCYTRRVLNALYHNDVPRKMRLKVLGDMDLDHYISSMSLTSKKERIFIILLKWRLYNLYDILRKLICAIK